MQALRIHRDRTPAVLHKQAKIESDARVARRVLAIANALDGTSREAAARSSGMDRQTLRDCVLRYNAHGVDGLADRWNGGRPPTLTAEVQAEIIEIVLEVSILRPRGGQRRARHDRRLRRQCRAGEPSIFQAR